MRIFFLCVLIACSTMVWSQPAAKQIRFSFLQAGDKVPALRLNHILQYPSPSTRLTDFKRKWLILDFWSTHCTACVESFDKLEQLQGKFKGRVQILLVNTSESPAKIKAFLAKRKTVTGAAVTLPVAIGDTALDGLFRHESVPFYTLINPEGIVQYMTSENEVNEQNISALLNHQPVEMQTRAWSSLSLDINKPLFIQNNGGNGPDLKWYSLLSKKVDGLSVNYYMNNSARTGSIQNGFNLDIRSLYQAAYYQEVDTAIDFNTAYGALRNSWVPNNRTILLLGDTSKVVERVGKKYIDENVYTYQLMGPPSTYTDMKKAMQADLKRFFGLDARIEKRKMKCLVFTAEDTALLHSKAVQPICRANDFGIDLADMPFSYFIFRLTYGNFFYSPYPIIDATGIKGNVDLRFDADMNNWESMDRALRPYRMHFALEEREINVLVLADPPH